jgi:hypothetical protein
MCIEHAQRMYCRCPVPTTKSRLQPCLRARRTGQLCTGNDIDYALPDSNWVCIDCAPVKTFPGPGKERELLRNLGENWRIERQGLGPGVVQEQMRTPEEDEDILRLERWQSKGEGEGAIGGRQMPQVGSYGDGGVYGSHDGRVRSRSVNGGMGEAVRANGMQNQGGGRPQENADDAVSYVYGALWGGEAGGHRFSR